MSYDAELLAAYASLTAQALVPIALGSFKSLKTPQSTIAKRKRSHPETLLSEDTEDEEEGIEETLTWADSLLFPVLGSVALVGLFLVIKYFGSEWLNLFLGVYFSGAGVFAVQSTLSSILAFAIRLFGYHPPTYHIRITSNLRQIFHLPLSLPSLLMLPTSIALPLLYIPLGRPWVLSNLLALCLSTATLALLRLDSFLTAGVLLGVLFIYDIFWVFATPVMVTVAKNIDAPIKLLAPRSTSPTGIDFAMLGLGDVVVPGLMVALCLRFDLALHAKRNPKREVTARSNFPRRYFWAGMVSYLIGLAVTMGVMHFSGRAQPALLYLSPACVLGPALLGLIRGELPEMWSYSDVPDESTKLDSSIEASSDIAQKGRAEKINVDAFRDGSAASLRKPLHIVKEVELEVPTPDGGTIKKSVELNVKINLRKSGEGDDDEDDEDGADKSSEQEGETEQEQEQEEGTAEEKTDESWMDGKGVAKGEEGKARKRKGKKK